MVQAQTVPHDTLIEAEMDRTMYFHDAALATLAGSDRRRRGAARRERRILLSIRALFLKHETMQRIAFLAREHTAGIEDHTDEFQSLCGCDPPASPEHFTIQAFLQYYAQAREITMRDGINSQLERRNSVYEIYDEQERYPELTLGPDEGLQDRLNMAN